MHRTSQDFQPEVTQIQTRSKGWRICLKLGDTTYYIKYNEAYHLANQLVDHAEQLESKQCSPTASTAKNQPQTPPAATTATPPTNATTNETEPNQPPHNADTTTNGDDSPNKPENSNHSAQTATPLTIYNSTTSQAHGNEQQQANNSALVWTSRSSVVPATEHEERHEETRGGTPNEVTSDPEVERTELITLES